MRQLHCNGPFLFLLPLLSLPHALLQVLQDVYLVLSCCIMLVVRIMQPATGLLCLHLIGTPQRPLPPHLLVEHSGVHLERRLHQPSRFLHQGSSPQ